MTLQKKAPSDHGRRFLLFTPDYYSRNVAVTSTRIAARAGT